MFVGVDKREWCFIPFHIPSHVLCRKRLVRVSVERMRFSLWAITITVKIVPLLCSPLSGWRPIYFVFFYQACSSYSSLIPRMLWMIHPNHRTIIQHMATSYNRSPRFWNNIYQTQTFNIKRHSLKTSIHKTSFGHHFKSKNEIYYI